jgi:hypothetical protein
MVPELTGELRLGRIARTIHANATLMQQCFAILLQAFIRLLQTGKLPVATYRLAIITACDHINRNSK